MDIIVKQVNDDNFEDYVEFHQKMFDYSSQLYQGLWSDDMKIEPKKIDQLKEDLNKHFESYIAYDGKTPVGMVCVVYLYSIFKAKNGFFIDEMIVDQNYRGKGIGKILIDKIKSVAKSRNYGRIDLTAGSNNPKALNFYEKTGAKLYDKYVFYRYDESTF